MRHIVLFFLVLLSLTSTAQDADQIRLFKRTDSLYRKVMHYDYVRYNPDSKLLYIVGIDTTWRTYSKVEIDAICQARKVDANALFTLLAEIKKHRFLYVGGGGVVDCDDCSTKITTRKRTFSHKYISYLVISNAARKISCSGYLSEDDPDPGDCIDASRKNLRRITNEIYRLVDRDIRKP